MAISDKTSFSQVERYTCSSLRGTAAPQPLYGLVTPCSKQPLRQSWEPAQALSPELIHVAEAKSSYKSWDFSCFFFFFSSNWTDLVYSQCGSFWPHCGDYGDCVFACLATIQHLQRPGTAGQQLLCVRPDRAWSKERAQTMVIQSSFLDLVTAKAPCSLPLLNAGSALHPPYR